jgi:hypothetical protein
MARRQTAPKTPYHPVTASENFHLDEDTYVAEMSKLEFERTPVSVTLWTGQRNLTFKYLSTDRNGDDVSGWRYVCESDSTLKMLIIND